LSQQQVSPQHVQEQAFAEALAESALRERNGKSARTKDFNVIGQT
jgi:hypothetical protein